ncbi:MAG: hypothetical protein AW10_02862 [Candidatus Accumulibacter appositus]|uniref:Uncharacterized protein n=1 Tax=Candidatus Accumulibacter appositus TaxID=1454003 RepID=A0A011N7Y4_9PROT|nr:MAG: hypothetical protein AW10_02862 [Candidatus Accumulibacter appositus]
MVMTQRHSPNHERRDRPLSFPVRSPACTPASLAGQGACSLNSPPHPKPSQARGKGSRVSRLRDFHVKENNNEC